MEKSELIAALERATKGKRERPFAPPLDLLLEELKNPLPKKWQCSGPCEDWEAWIAHNEGKAPVRGFLACPFCRRDMAKSNAC